MARKRGKAQRKFDKVLKELHAGKLRDGATGRLLNPKSPADVKKGKAISFSEARKVAPTFGKKKRGKKFMVPKGRKR